MSYKPEKHELIDFIYGELDQAKKQKIQNYLDQNPEEKKELEALKDVRTIMGSFADQEVIEPVVIMNQGGTKWDVWKKYLAVAASVSVILFLALLLDIKIGLKDNALSISMGPVTPQAIEQPATSASVSEEWMAKQDSLFRYMAVLEKRINVEAGKEVDNVSLSSSDAQRIVRQALEEYKRDNRNVIADLVSQSEEQQKEFIQGLFTAFAREIEYQREEDLQLINAGFQTLKDETDLKYREAELLLSALQNNEDITQNNY